MQLIRSKVIPAPLNAFWEPLPEEWSALGARRCLVLTLPYAAGSAEEQTLLKMLGACRLGADDCHILQLRPEQRVAWHKLKDQLRPRFVLLLGTDLASLGISALFRLNEPNAFDDCTFIPSLGLGQLIQHPDMRTALWTQGLKPVFAP